MRHLLLAGCFAAALAGGARPAGAEILFFPSRDRTLGTDDILDVGYKRWESEGRGSFRISFPFPFPTSPPLPPGAGFGGSTLDFQRINAPLNIFSAEVRPTGWLFFDVDIAGQAFSGGGIGHDHDWISAPGYKLTDLSNGYVFVNPSQTDFSESISSLSGDTHLSDANAYLRVFAFRESVDEKVTYTHLFDVSVGYLWYSDVVHMRQGVQVAAPDPNLSPAPLGPFNGLDSKYTFAWKGVRLGVRETTLFGSGWSAEGRFGIMPSMDYQGRGYWNLRPDFAQNPSFTQSGTGTGIDYSLGVAYTAMKALTLRVGYMGCYFHLRNGTDRVFFSDGTSASDLLEAVDSERKGMYASATLQY